MLANIFLQQGPVLGRCIVFAVWFVLVTKRAKSYLPPWSKLDLRMAPRGPSGRWVGQPFTET